MGKINVEVEIKSDVDLFFDLFAHKPYLLPTVSPQLVTGYELHAGEIGTVGSVVSWSNTHDGRVIVDKEEITDIDDEKKMMSYKYLDGIMLDMYKSLAFGLHVHAKGDKNVVTWTVEFEKRNEDVPDPDFILEFFQNISNSIDEYIKP